MGPSGACHWRWKASKLPPNKGSKMSILYVLLILVVSDDPSKHIAVKGLTLELCESMAEAAMKRDDVAFAGCIVDSEDA